LRLGVGIGHSVVHRSSTSRSVAWNLMYPAHRCEKRRDATAGSDYAATDKRLSPCERSRSSTLLRS
jgi:hypothetical protein